MTTLLIVWLIKTNKNSKKIEAYVPIADFFFFVLQNTKKDKIPGFEVINEDYSL